MEPGALLRQPDADYAPVVGVPLARDQSLFLQPVDDAGQVAHRHHHFFADLAEGKAAGVADGCQDVELGRGQIELFQVILQSLVGKEIEAQKADP